MVNTPPTTGNAQLDRFLRSVADDLRTLAKPREGWRLSDFSADVSEVISDRRDLIDIVRAWGRIEDLEDSLADELKKHLDLYDSSLSLNEDLGGLAGTFSEIQRWWDENPALYLEDRAKISNALSKAEEALNTSQAATSAANSAESSASNAVSRVTALEAMSGLSPESPVDGQTANLIEQPETLTRKSLTSNFIQMRNRPVNLADRMPAGHTPSDDATEILETALAESDTVVWPENLDLTFRNSDSVTIPEGRVLTGSPGAQARIEHGNPGFKVYGRVSGISVDRPGYGANNMAVGFWIMPGSSDTFVTDCRLTGGHHAGVAVGGASDTIEGVASQPTISNVIAEDMTGASSYGFRLDTSHGVTLENCQSWGATLDNIKVRVLAKDPRITGGYYANSRGGDGIDAFAGIQGGYIGGGIIFEDNGLNSIVIKTDAMTENYEGVPVDSEGNVLDKEAARREIANQIERFGLPRQTILQGVIARGAKVGGVSLVRSNSLDPEYRLGWPMPWLSDIQISGMLIDSPAGIGLNITAYNALVSGVQVLNSGAMGVNVGEFARQIRLNQVAVRGAGRDPAQTGLQSDGVVLRGKDIWLSQVFVDGARHGHWADETEAAVAEKVTRVGFNSATIDAAKTHHFSQCASVRTTTGGLGAASRNYSVHLDGSYEEVSGTSVGGGAWMRGTGGFVESSTNGTSYSRIGNRSVTAEELANIDHAVNTQGKETGVLAWDFINRKLYVAGASAPGTVWFEVGGEGATITPA